MTKIVLDNIVSTQNVQKLNDNFQKIVEEFENTVSREPGSNPNFMESDFDLNGNRLLNVPAPVSEIDVVRQVDVAPLVTPLLATKQNKLVSGENIRTINGQSLLGSGNIEVQGGSGGGGTTDHDLLINKDLPNQHPISAVTGLQTTLDSKAAATHTHTISNVTGLQTALDGKASAVHTHAIADVTGLQAALDNRQPIDTDLTALAALNTTGVVRRTGAATFSTLADVKEIVVSTTAPTDTTKLWLDIN